MFSLTSSLPSASNNELLATALLPCLPAYYNVPHHDNGLALQICKQPPNCFCCCCCCLYCILFCLLLFSFFVSYLGHGALHSNRTKTNIVITLFFFIYLCLLGFLVCLFLLLLFWNKVLLCSPDWPGTHLVDHIDRVFRDPPASAS